MEITDLSFIHIGDGIEVLNTTVWDKISYKVIATIDKDRNVKTVGFINGSILLYIVYYALTQNPTISTFSETAVFEKWANPIPISDINKLIV